MKQNKEGQPKFQVANIKPLSNNLVIFEVKPSNTQTSLDELAQTIFNIQIDGISWRNQYKKLPIAYGIEKLVIGAEFDQKKVSTNDIKDKIKGLKKDV